MKDIFKNTKSEDLSKIGVYTITSKVTGRIYVGMTRNKDGFKRRWIQHKSSLKKGNHRNVFLQRHYDKYGINDLKFEILDTYEFDHCLSMELFWINTLDSVKNGFNLTHNSQFVNGSLNPVFKFVDFIPIINDYKNTDITFRDLSKKHNVNQKKIRKHFKDNNIKITDKTSIEYQYDLNKMYNHYLNSRDTIKKSSEKFGGNKKALISYMKRNNLKSKYEIVRDDIDKLKKRNINGEFIVDIAKEYNVCNSFMLLVFKENNIKVIKNEKK